MAGIDGPISLSLLRFAILSQTGKNKVFADASLITIGIKK